MNHPVNLPRGIRLISRSRSLTCELVAQFALHVEPKNADAERKILWAQDARAAGKPTVPSTVGEELLFNPFMRVGQPSVQSHVGGGSDVEVMRKLRNAKDRFAGSSRPWIPGGGPLPGL